MGIYTTAFFIEKIQEERSVDTKCAPGVLNSKDSNHQHQKFNPPGFLMVEHPGNIKPEMFLNRKKIKK